MPPDPAKSAKKSIPAPTGTRDFYPQDMLRRRYITDAWRRVSLRHGFDEIDGPTFESADLYKVKSGEGILNEMFGVYSVKAESGRTMEPRPLGSGSSAQDAFDPLNPPYALRPEFTPTLARMYAARAKQLPQPTKWFCIPNFFRAERPQRGRLREFYQWNCDVIGGDYAPQLDAEIIATAISALGQLGLAATNARVKVSDRTGISRWGAQSLGLPQGRETDFFSLLDNAFKVSREQFIRDSLSLGISSDKVGILCLAVFVPPQHEEGQDSVPPEAVELQRLFDAFDNEAVASWCDYRATLARGLAYYTGTVFEVIAEGERAVAGGGRYDNLIELFGGPPTPACGFGMGDVVLGNLLDDRKLIPEGKELLEALARPMPLRPDAFIIASPNEGCEELIVPTVARLRRGEESEKYKQGEAKPWSAERYAAPPLHARRSYKATKNVGKLLSDASACHARFAAIIESPEKCTLKNLDTGEQTPDVPLEQLGPRIARNVL